MCDIKQDWRFSDDLFMRPVTPKDNDVVDFLPGRFCLLCSKTLWETFFENCC